MNDPPDLFPFPDCTATTPTYQPRLAATTQCHCLSTTRRSDRPEPTAALAPRSSTPTNHHQT